MGMAVLGISLWAHLGSPVSTSTPCLLVREDPCLEGTSLLIRAD